MEKIRFMRSILILARPQHYIKNIFVFLPLFFAGQFGNMHLLLEATIAFLCFNAISSSVYIFNDIIDAEEDRLHPENKNRPIAAGVISKFFAYMLDLLISITVLTFAFLFSKDLFFILLSYKILNIFYTVYLKQIAVIDVMIISLGFVFRLYAGSVVTGILLSEWIIILTFLLSMLLALGKRRNDAIACEKDGIFLRTSVKSYNLTFLNYSMLIIASVIIVAYVMYTVSPETSARIGTEKLYVTVFWVIAGILRYLQLLFVKEQNINPVSLLIKDHPMKFILLAWFINLLLFIYII